MNQADNQQQLENFAVFPKHVGVWQGDWILLDANARKIDQFTGLLTQKIIDNQWIQTNEHEFADGTKVNQTFVGKVVGPGKVEVESSDLPFANYNMIAQEQGDHLLIFNIRDKATGNLLATETINLIQENQRVRTVQRFTPDGEFKGVMLIIEHRIG